MMLMNGILATVALGAFAALTQWTGAFATEYQVLMTNKDAEGQLWQFEPAFLQIAPGDSVRFVPTDKGHNTEATPKTIPEGANPWKGKINEPITIKYMREGIYVYKCLPHAGLGMVGVIQVGESTVNLEAVKNVKMPGKAVNRLAELIAQVGN
jgi:pseudoazurin